MDVLDIVREKQSSGTDGDLDAMPGGEGTRIYSDPDDDGAKVLVNYTNADEVDASILYLLIHEIRSCAGNINISFPDVTKRVSSNRSQLSGLYICLHIGWYEPDVGARTNDEAGLRGKTIVSELVFFRRRNNGRW